MNLILVGYRGSGKSTVGTVLAKRLGWRFVDLDDVIVKQAGRTIRDVFAQEGEDGFRRREKEAFISLRRTKQSVISLGGGAVLDSENRSVIKRLGKVVWLRAPAVVLWSRIKSDPDTSNNRPNLTPTGGLAEIEAKLAEREPIYSGVAHHTVDTKSDSPQKIAEAIEMWLLATLAGEE